MAENEPDLHRHNNSGSFLSWIPRSVAAITLSAIAGTTAFLADLPGAAEGYDLLCAKVGVQLPFSCPTARNLDTAPDEEPSSGEGPVEEATEPTTANTNAPFDEELSQCRQEIDGWCVESSGQAASTTVSDCSLQGILESRGLRNPPETLFLVASEQGEACALRVTSDQTGDDTQGAIPSLLEGRIADSLKKCAVSHDAQSLIPCDVSHQLEYLGAVSGDSVTEQDEHCLRTVSSFSARQAGHMGSGVNATIWGGPDGADGCWLMLAESSSESAERY